MARPNANDITTASFADDQQRPSRTVLGAIAQFCIDLATSFGAASGVATLDANAKIPDAQLARNENNGVAPLDATGKLPALKLPDPGDGLQRDGNNNYAIEATGAESADNEAGEFITGLSLNDNSQITAITKRNFAITAHIGDWRADHDAAVAALPAAAAGTVRLVTGIDYDRARREANNPPYRARYLVIDISDV